MSTTTYAMQQRDGGLISQGKGREIIQTIEPIVLSQMSMGEPIKLSTTYFSFVPDHLFLPKIG